MNNVSLRLVFDRKHVATKKHQSSVQLEVMYQRKRKYLSTGVKLYSDQWTKDGKVKNHPQAVGINQQLSNMQAEIFDFIYQLTSQNIEFTFDRLDNFLNAPSATPAKEKSFLIWMEKRIGERSVSEPTKQRQRCVLKALKEFGRISSFSDVTSANIRAYDDFAKSRCTCQSSVYNYHKILKVFVREAFFANLIDENPYESFKLDRGKRTVRRFLTKEELIKLETKEIEEPCLNRVRDLFLFCCYTGLAYADLSKFDFKNTIYTDGMYRIRDCRVKTNTQYNISLIDKAMDILKKYDFSLPIISNQKYNLYLKVVASFCEIKKRLTSHVARHTFATTIAMGNGVRIEVISKMLGHTNIQTTQIYAHIFQSEVDKEFERLNTVV